MDRTDTHVEVGSGAYVPEVKPGLARRTRPEPGRSPDRLERTLSAACGAICGVFAGPTEDPEAWLGAACGHVLRLLAEVGEGDGVGGASAVRGVWAGLLDGAGWRPETSPLIGAAGFLDEIEREDVRARVRDQIREAASRGWAPRRVTDRTLLVLDRPAWTSGIGSLAASVPDGHGGEAALLLGIVAGGAGGSGGGGGGEVPADRLGAATRAVWEGLVRAAGERIVRPRAGRRRLVAGLSGAQLQVLTLLIEGITEHEIASRLGRSRHTVHDHVRTIYKTLGMGSKTELITAWNDAGRR